MPPAGKGWLEVLGAAPPQPQVVLVTCPTSLGPSETEEVVLLSAAGVRLVPVDRREALGVMDVLCGQSSVQDLRVRPRLGKPGRQSCVSQGPRQGAGRGRRGQSSLASTWDGWENGAKEESLRWQERCSLWAESLCLRTLRGRQGRSLQRGWGICTTHSSIRKCPRKGTGPRWQGQRRGHPWEGDGTTTRRLVATTMFDTVLYKNEFKKGDDLRGVRGRVK